MENTWREYAVKIERRDHGDDVINLFAADRDDAIKFVKRVYKGKLCALTSARLTTPSKADLELVAA